MWSIHHSSMVALMLKSLPAKAGDTRNTDSILVLGRYPREGNGNPLQHSCLENSTDRGAWQTTVHGVAKSWTRQSNWAHTCIIVTIGFPGGSVVKKLPANAGDVGSIPGLGRCPGEVNGNPLQYSCLGNPMDRGAWWATVKGVAKIRLELVTKQHYHYSK